MKSAGPILPTRRSGSGNLAGSGVYRSGQTGQTVNLMAYAFVGSNPTAPMTHRPRSDAGFLLFSPFALLPDTRAHDCGQSDPESDQSNQVAIRPVRATLLRS